MLSHLFLGMSLLGAEWVLYLLLIISVVSVAAIIERYFFYKKAQSGLPQFRAQIRAAVADGKIADALQVSKQRQGADLESEMTHALLTQVQTQGSPKILNETAADAVMRGKVRWEKNLALLATVGSNAPFVGLFGTVLGIIKAFHDLSQSAGAGAQTVSSGISEALVATAVGILVAIPAVVAFNFFQKRVKTAVNEAEAMKSFIIGKLGRE